ncbi:hypothetical protein HZS_7266 [Henneguya salminicola]|nr:hypothetical protein HZS_7266 [Henneguya salminicola]
MLKKFRVLNSNPLLFDNNINRHLAFLFHQKNMSNMNSTIFFNLILCNSIMVVDWWVSFLYYCPRRLFLCIPQCKVKREDLNQKFVAESNELIKQL